MVCAYHRKGTAGCTRLQVHCFSAHLVPVAREVVTVMHQEVTPVHLDVGAYPEVLGAIAQLTWQVFGWLGPIEVLQCARHSTDVGRPQLQALQVQEHVCLCVPLVQTVDNIRVGPAG